MKRRTLSMETLGSRELLTSLIGGDTDIPPDPQPWDATDTRLVSTTDGAVEVISTSLNLRYNDPADP